jgi:hypothetical protein
MVIREGGTGNPAFPVPDKVAKKFCRDLHRDLSG